MMPASQEDGTGLRVVSLQRYVKEKSSTSQQGQPFDPILYLNVTSSNSGTSTHMSACMNSKFSYTLFLALLMYSVSQSRPASQRKFDKPRSAVDEAPYRAVPDLYRVSVTLCKLSILLFYF